MTQPLAIGIDIGGTHTSFGLINEAGKILVKNHILTTGHKTVEDYIKALKQELTPLIESVGKENIVGIGVGAPNGNFYTGEIADAPNLPWKGVIPFSKLINEAFGCNTVVTNDANAAAIGEMKYGAAKGMKDFILITLGTGVGSGIVANGKLIYGHDGFAGEVGHITAVRDGRTCNCGKKGCLETYTSATGIVRSANLLMEQRSDESLLRPDNENLTAELIYKAALKNDALALELFEYTGKILGQTLADVCAITSPQAIIFFGGLANARELLLKPVKEHLEKNLLGIYQNKISLLYSALPDGDAAILGASALVWE